MSGSKASPVREQLEQAVAHDLTRSDPFELLTTHKLAEWLIDGIEEARDKMAAWKKSDAVGTADARHGEITRVLERLLRGRA